MIDYTEILTTISWLLAGLLSVSIATLIKNQ